MSKIKTLNAKRCVAVFMAMLMTTLSLSYTQSNQVNAVKIPEIRTYWRHNYSDSDLKSYSKYNLIVDSNTNARTIFPPNDMVRDYDTAVVRIDGNGYGGTGFIVGDHEIATAAHCVYSRGDDEFLKFNISIIDANNNVIKTISPHYVHINKAYEDARNYTASSPYDYAMIYVDEDLSKYGKFSLGVALDSYADKNGSVIVSGFPSSEDYPEGYENSDWGIRFKAAGNITSKTQNMLRYNADTATGDSGGPVYIEEKRMVNGELQEYKTAIAINVCYNDDYNASVRMTAEVLKLYGDNPNKTE